MKQTNQNDEFLRKRKERQKKMRKRRLKVFFMVFVILLLIIGVLLSLTVLFPIKNINAKGSKVYTKAEILNSCGIKAGDNLFVVSSKETLNTLKSKLPFIENVEFDRSLPDTLEIKVTDAKEFACYMVDNKYYTVSKSGWTLACYDEKPENVILIISDSVKCKVGSAVELDKENFHTTAQSVIDILQKYKISVNYVDITNEVGLKAKVDNRFIVNFGSSTDLENKVRHLNSMIKEIDKNDTGNINLSMWSSQNTQGTFVQTDIK